MQQLKNFLLWQAVRDISAPYFAAGAPDCGRCASFKQQVAWMQQVRQVSGLFWGLLILEVEVIYIFIQI